MEINLKYFVGNVERKRKNEGYNQMAEVIVHSKEDLKCIIRAAYLEGWEDKRDNRPIKEKEYANEIVEKIEYPFLIKTLKMRKEQ